ncbi:MAG: hypothetical protein ABF292_14165 [Desulfobacterales bacterium]
MTNKLRFIVGLCLVLPARMTIFNTLLEAVVEMISASAVQHCI